MNKSKLIGGCLAVVVAIATPVTAMKEGLRLKAYLDPIGIPTICYGETEGVRMGQVKSKAECDRMLSIRLAYFAMQVQREVSYTIPVETHAALASWAYNVGAGGAMRKSTLMRHLRAGRIVEACNQLPRWNKAGGKVWAGLVKRRELERQLCLKGAV